MKKINTGYYTAQVNGFTVAVTRTVYDNGRVAWYNGIAKDGKILSEGSDHYNTKKEAYEAICYVANHPQEYGINISK